MLPVEVERADAVAAGAVPVVRHAVPRPRLQAAVGAPQLPGTRPQGHHRDREDVPDHGHIYEQNGGRGNRPGQVCFFHTFHTYGALKVSNFLIYSYIPGPDLCT